MELLLSIQLIGPVVFVLLLLATGFFSGRYLERKHYARIIEDETAPGQVMVFAERLPPPRLPAPQTQLVMGSVVISVDYYKRFIAGLRQLIGGRLNSYESLIDRARREALLRMRAEAKKLGAQQVFNIKFETAAISGRGRENSVGSLEVLAYGTALIDGR
ncbi:YbjQ family protein [Marinimicrobium sp. ABcell2]|uniref:YbjQ family protein n=1 Tax=Marinimicrobium sp. ABcell2 TaxID=3069751 RepID=UPI0027AE2E3B|nr:heavy metal-binding domain-containing protein [Marinimicrobium sp. ABcell2]MDQ2078375.1 heavy metal-binding domain-containing protein [Marinimicrobium sp. ABcell2]